MDLMNLGIASVAAITVICYLVGQVVKASGVANKWIPCVCGFCGALLGVLWYTMRWADYPAADPVTAAAVGIVSGLASTGVNQIFKQMTREAGADE